MFLFLLFFVLCSTASTQLVLLRELSVMSVKHDGGADGVGCDGDQYHGWLVIFCLRNLVVGILDTNYQKLFSCKVFK